MSQHFVTGYSLNTNLNVQYSLAQDAVAQAGYSGSFSRHLPDMLDINQIPHGGHDASRPGPSTACSRTPAINEVQSVGNGDFNCFLLL